MRPLLGLLLAPPPCPVRPPLGIRLEASSPPPLASAPLTPQQKLAQLHSIRPRDKLYRAARQMLVNELRQDGMQRVEGPLHVAHLPGATRAFGWRSELLYGARASASQFVFLSGWSGSAAVLGSTVLLVFPLLVNQHFASLAYAATFPAANACRWLKDIADHLAIALLSAGVSVSSLLLSISNGSPISAGAALRGGPPLLLTFTASLRERPLAGLLYGAWLNCGWAALQEELIFRSLLQSQLARAFAALQSQLSWLFRKLSTAMSHRDLSTHMKAKASTQNQLLNETRSVNQFSVYAARGISSLCFALAHLSSDPRPWVWAVDIPTTIAAGLSSFFCFGRLYDTRGLAAAIGAHAFHNSIICFFLMLKLCEGRKISGSILVPSFGHFVPIVIYSVAFYRWRRRSARSNRAT